jgi:endonuclease/exonuclease/phosphatase family metal-dependent hydrolase
MSSNLLAPTTGNDRLHCSAGFRSVVFAAAILVSFAGRPVQAADVEVELNIVTFNVLVDLGRAEGIPPWNERKDLCAKLLRETDADLVGLQEALPHQVKFFLETLPGYSAFHHPDFTDATILYKTATFKRLEQGHWWLSPTPEKPSSGFGNFLPRILVWVKLEHLESGRQLYFFNTHFDNSQPSQTKMAALCEEKMKPFIESGLPMIFVGDFNTDQRRGDYEKLTSNGWEDAYRVSEHASPLGRDDNITTFVGAQKRIDHIFFQAERARAESWRRLESPDPTRQLSDHFPVQAIITLK